MLNRGIIQPTTKPWHYLLCSSRRKITHGFVSIFVGWMQSATKIQTITRIDDTLCAKYFSTMTFMSGYWQAEMDPTLREHTAFITYGGLFQSPPSVCQMPPLFTRGLWKFYATSAGQKKTSWISVVWNLIVVMSLFLFVISMPVMAQNEKPKAIHFNINGKRLTYYPKHVRFLIILMLQCVTKIHSYEAFWSICAHLTQVTLLLSALLALENNLFS